MATQTGRLFRNDCPIPFEDSPRVAFRSRPRAIAGALVVGLMASLLPLAAIAAQPIITGVVIVNVGVINAGTTATAEILVQSDSATFTLDGSSNIGFYGLLPGTFAKDTDERYTVDFAVDEGENDYAAGTPIPVTITLSDGDDSGVGPASITYGSDIDANSPPKPWAPDLEAASDNGQFATDDVTNENMPTFIGGAGAAEPGSTVRLYRGGTTLLGTDTADPVDGSWSIPSALIPDGTHSITVTATDAAGNVSEVSEPLSVLVDTQPPNDPGSRAPLNNAWVDTTSPTFSWSAPGDPGGSGVYNYRVQIWGPPERNYYTPNLSYNPSLGAEGTYTWRLYALDVAGNNGDVGASTWTLNVDTSPPGKPAIPDLNAASDKGQSATDDVTNENMPTFIGGAGAAEQGSTVRLYRGGTTLLGTDTADPVDGSWSIPSALIPDGTHSMTVTATDAAGNESVASDALTVVIDTQAPTCSVPDLLAADDTGELSDDDVTQGNTPQFDGTASDASAGSPAVASGVWKVDVSSDAPVQTVTDSSGGGTYTTELATLTEGDRTVSATVTDVAGNTYTSANLPLLVDRTDPTCSVPDLLAADDTGELSDDDVTQGNTPQFDGTASDASSGVWKVDVTASDTTTGTDSSAPFYSVELATLSQGSLTVSATVTDVAGNTYTSGNLPLSVDRTNPTCSVPDLLAADDTGELSDDDVTQGNTPQFDGTASDASSGVWKVDVSSDAPVQTVTDSSGGGTYTTELATLTEGDRTVSATVTDVAGNTYTSANLPLLVDRTNPTCSVPDLLAADDTGYSDSDDITQGITPQFDGTASDASAGSPAVASGVWKVDVSSDAPIQTVTDSSGGGTYTVELADLTAVSPYTVVSVSARVSDVAGNTYDTTSLTVYADRTPPAITLIAVEEVVGFCGTSCYSLALPPGEFDVTIDFSESVWQGAGNELTLTFDLDSADWLGAPASGDGNTLSFAGIGPENTSATAVWQPQDELRTNVVEDGDNSCDLSVTAISLAGSLFDVAGNAFVVPALDATNNVTDAQDVSVDTTKPLIGNLMFNTDGTYAVEKTVPYLVDECGLVVVYFSATVTDNCSILAGNVDVSVTLPMLQSEGPAILEDIVVTPVQNGQDRVDISGHAVVRCLESCPPDVCMSRVQVDVAATDCGGNAADPAATGVGEGLVDDDILPIPRDDPRQDMVMDESAVIDPLVEVRLDEFGTYRLILRENTPVRIDVMANDADNLSHNAAHPFEPCVQCGPCGGQTGCCAVMYIHEIVEPPSYGTATIEDGTGDCRGGTVIRYAPDHGRLGPDYFTYRTRDAFGNVSSVIATVYLQTVEETVMEDVAIIACSGEPTEFDVVAADLWVDRDPAVITFGFEIVDGPSHGVVVGDPTQITLSPPSLGPDPNTGELVPTLDFTEAARIRLTYTSTVDHVGRDSMMIRIDDPFGAFAVARVDIRVIECAPGAGAVPTIEVGPNVVVPIIVPASFAVVAETSPGAVLLMSTEDGLIYPGALSILWSEEMHRYVLFLHTETMPLGRYSLTIPIGNGDRVELIIEVGETE